MLYNRWLLTHRSSQKVPTLSTINMSTPGSCLCGEIKFEFSGEPLKRVLCHCTDCRKVSGAHYSDNAIVSDDAFKLLSGSPKSYAKSADSGKLITSYFCANCGCTVYRVGEWLPGHKIVKAGLIDDNDWMSKNVPTGEVWCQRRMQWLPDFGFVDGAKEGGSSKK